MATRKPYPSDVSDEEWAFVAPYLALVREDAPQRNHDLREVFNGLRWIVRTGSAWRYWRYLPHDLPTQGKPSTSRRGGGWRLAYSRRWSTISPYSCGFRRAERPIRRYHTGLAHPTIHAGERLSGWLRRGEAQERYEGTRSGGYPWTPARLACETSQRAGARACGQVGRECARGHGRVGGTGIRGPRLYRREASYTSGESWHEVGGGQARGGQAGLCATSAPLGSGAGFRMGIAISAAGEGLREAARHFGGASLCRLRLPLPPASERHPRRGFITRSRRCWSCTVWGGDLGLLASGRSRVCRSFW